jgi:hypothetical protein
MNLFKKDKTSEQNIGGEKPVCIFMTDKTYEAEIVRGLLESSDIEAFIITSGREKDLMLPITKLFEQEPDKHYKIYVRPEDEADAKELLSSSPKEE